MDRKSCLARCHTEWGFQVKSDVHREPESTFASGKVQPTSDSIIRSFDQNSAEVSAMQHA